MSESRISAQRWRITDNSLSDSERSGRKRCVARQSTAASCDANLTRWTLQKATADRNELLGRRPHNAATPDHNAGTPENPYRDSALPRTSAFSGQTSASGSGLNYGPSQPADYNRQLHAMREDQFYFKMHTHLDEFLERGRNVLADLGHQREMLKGTQRRLYNVGNTLGISGDMIRKIERRAREDKLVFWGGVVVFILFCWLVLHFLR